MSTDDDPRSGRPSDSVEDETIAIMSALLNEDHRRTIREIEQQIVAEYSYVQNSVGSIHSFIHDHLQMRQVSARWVPHQLADAHKRDRMAPLLSSCPTTTSTLRHFWTKS